MRLPWPWSKRTVAVASGQCAQRANHPDVHITNTPRSDSPTDSTNSAATTVDVQLDEPRGRRSPLPARHSRWPFTSARTTVARRLRRKSSSAKQPASITARAPPRVSKPDMDSRAALQLERFCKQHSKTGNSMDDDKYMSSVAVWSNLVVDYDLNSAPRLRQDEQQRASARAASHYT